MSDFIRNDILPPEAGKLESWLVRQLKDHGSTLLAFADDGVIWGRLVNGELAIAPNAPALRETTLQQAYVFGETCEVRLFRDEMGSWQVRRVVDGSDPTRIISESQILWGNESKGMDEKGFLKVSEFRSGIPDQFLPVGRPLGNEECARLEVHHLVEYDEETGEAYIALSRLAGLSVGKRAEVAK